MKKNICLEEMVLIENVACDIISFMCIKIQLFVREDFSDIKLFMTVIDAVRDIRNPLYRKIACDFWLILCTTRSNNLFFVNLFNIQ